jgi:hypothetical protein
MTKMELTEAERTLITSNQSVQEARLRQATYASVISVPINAITGSNLDRNQIPPSVLRDLWINRFGVGWVDAKDVPMDYMPVQQQLWFAGQIQKLYRPDVGREVWRIFDANN